MSAPPLCLAGCQHAHLTALTQAKLAAFLPKSTLHSFLSFSKSALELQLRASEAYRRLCRYSSWHQSSTSSLARLSFKLHHDLAQEYHGDIYWGYRNIETLVNSFAAPRQTTDVGRQVQRLARHNIQESERQTRPRCRLGGSYKHHRLLQTGHLRPDCASHTKIL